MRPYSFFKIKQPQSSNRAALTSKEVARIEALEFEPGSSDGLARDIFLMGCWTGLRFSDIVAIKKSDIVWSRAAVELNVLSKKTEKRAALPLSELHAGKPADLVMRYASVENPRGLKLFPSISNQAANRSLKTVAAAAGIAKTLTMHVSRHTFATLLVGHVSIPILQELLQHSDIKTTMRYVHLSNAAIVQELRAVDWTRT